MVEVRRPRKIGSKRKKTRSIRPKPSPELKPITPQYVSFAPSDLAERHPVKARVFFLFMFALASMHFGPKLWNWSLDRIWPTRAYVNDILIWHKLLCDDVENGVIQVRQTICDEETGCSPRDSTNLIIEANVNHRISKMCERDPMNPNAVVEEIFVAMNRN